MKKYLVKRTFLHFIVGDVIEDITKVFQPGYVEELEKCGYIEYIEEKVISVLPKSWNDLDKITGWYADSYSSIGCVTKTALMEINKNIFPTKEEAEASIALAQLCQLRDKYNEGWKPDFKDSSQPKFVIYFNIGVIGIVRNYLTQRVLIFKTKELAEEFKNNFSDLIKKAKPLL